MTHVWLLLLFNLKSWTFALLKLPFLRFLELFSPSSSGRWRSWLLTSFVCLIMTRRRPKRKQGSREGWRKRRKKICKLNKTSIRIGSRQQRLTKQRGVTPYMGVGHHAFYSIVVVAERWRCERKVNCPAPCDEILCQEELTFKNFSIHLFSKNQFTWTLFTFIFCRVASILEEIVKE